MSKKYVLIEEYPNSPKLGLEIFKNGAYWQSDFCTKGVEHFHSRYDFNPKDFPKNWKEVVEPPYAVLVMHHPIWKLICTPQQDGKWAATEPNHMEYGYYDTKKMLKIGYVIQSVKRLSDGVVFTVGDELDERSFIKNAKREATEVSKNIIVKIGVPKDLHSDVVAKFCDSKFKGVLFFSANNEFNHYNVPLEYAVLAKEVFL